MADEDTKIEGTRRVEERKEEVKQENESDWQKPRMWTTVFEADESEHPQVIETTKPSGKQRIFFCKFLIRFSNIS